MDTIKVSIGLAFLAGLASFFSPCVFSLVPAYVGYLSGRSISAQEAGVNKLRTFLHGLAFVLGFSFVFISLGLAFSVFSLFFYQIRDILAKAGGVIIILFGMQMTGLINIPFLNYDFRPQSKLSQGSGFFASFLMGVVFSAGWSPCVGPTLGLILTLAIERANIGQGVSLLSIYSLGMALPFLIAALGVGWVTDVLRKYGKVMHRIQIVMGILLILVGVMLFLGIYQQLATFDRLIDFGI
ncbi:MAG TPA: cytochrome c biogenesis protein CcdA [Brevefilum fermentans]|jgi:cytochrome c-type biogenesis protein|uniref:Cytochrome c-type biogenesis protein CcdA n=1 Tax=Candidatus Brevifilum fermentans TaxID=1986204 RepID=A0A1Y6K4E9_9CHLR|nr:cytochrome c biogenesis protein CcdA [Brevefilum fermentans]MDI9566459.1 cytochrome c biogenesis protein CcdA [Chloroflexota bacterium]SMX54551.1 Cytochrome c-type biogenesis protein CcdA [Brevefilum fermentans]HOM67161.1 cytochrome c biogenesis protein CcdA [Brevefilum fermentans]HPX95725.1 cytochrome c biogenesis protein CcdA [Brevefilum fermentans]HQA27909.1 cytochrome c biogenesis protein CcdA [Brevefilum fermentans]